MLYFKYSLCVVYKEVSIKLRRMGIMQFDFFEVQKLVSNSNGKIPNKIFKSDAQEWLFIIRDGESIERRRGGGANIL